MDIGAKSLAQLAAEHNEKKYVTLETASKLSGYTSSYIERLCRLGKVEYRFWNNDQFVPELESLLKETHTILVSYEGIQTINKDETRDPLPSPYAPISIGEGREEVGGNAALHSSPARPLTFIGRSVISGAEVSQKMNEDLSLSSPGGTERTSTVTLVDMPNPFAAAKIPVPVEVEKVEETQNVLPQSPSPVAEKGPVHLAVVDGNSVLELQGGQQSSVLVQDPNLPMVEPEHNLMVPEVHPLSKNVALNLILLAMVLLSTLLIGGIGKMEGLTEFGNDSLISGVAESFSDIVEVRRDADGNSVIVRPIFRSGPGSAQEFQLTPVSNPPRN